MSIDIYNTLTRKKELFVPREPGKVSMYVCGPTVYNYIHIGNARTFLNFDMIRRYMEFVGFDVTFVQNITDVDDKIINRANEEGSTPAEVAERYGRIFEEDMAALGVKPPTIAPRATDHIEEMTGFITSLIKNGSAYESQGDVYFRVESFPSYGKLSGRDTAEQQSSGEPGAGADRKEGEWDFALWKAAKPGEPAWDSPWGPGRPGWHIECSTMSMKYLGEGFDIHGGGLDLVFPHHENEIAQAEACSGNEFARYWMHSGMLNIDSEKMSKSIGNILQLREVLREHDADTIRMLMLATHYRSPLNFTPDSLSEAHAQVERVRNCMFNIDDLAGRVPDGGAGKPEFDGAERELLAALQTASNEFLDHMNDDFNSAAALGSLFTAIREINAYVARAPLAERMPQTVSAMLAVAREFITLYFGTLGLAIGGREQSAPSTEAPDAIDTGKLLQLAEEAGVDVAGLSTEEIVDALCGRRLEARKEKEFALSDRIRDGLAGLGIRVEDVADGFRWRIER